MEFNQRYSLLKEKNPSEIVLLQGRGCFWKKCTFCDYYLDAASETKAIALNEKVLEQVTGETGALVVLNSGSYSELPQKTQEKIMLICKEKHLLELSIESHWVKRETIVKLKEALKNTLGKNFTLHARIGIETFNENFREKTLKKGMGFKVTPQKIAEYFDECCLLMGVLGQKTSDLIKDIALAKAHFKQIYINIFTENTKNLQIDQDLIQWFHLFLLPKLKTDPQITILLNNTDLGVGD